MSENPLYIYSPYDEIIYPSHNGGGCLGAFLYTVIIMMTLLVMIATFSSS